jgi:hypothetical protein
MKFGVVFFHKKIRLIYNDRWINKSVKSILDQTLKNFSIYELNYGGDNYSVFEGIEIKNPHFFINHEKDNHADAMNSIIELAFQDGCDCVFNTNLDDFYDVNRFLIQSSYIKNGYDLVSSDFCYVEEKNGEDVVVFSHNIKKFGDIKENLDKGHNIIAHPCVAYSKKFWKENKYIPEEIPKEDMLLWVRSLNKGFKFYICDEILLSYRLHQNQVTGNNSIELLNNSKEISQKIVPKNNSFVDPIRIK